MIVATGLDILPMDKKPEYGGTLPNVMSPLAMERIQSSNGPYGRVLRPADGKIPRSIAYIQCAGSRDRSIGVPYCSRVCCMYALKQALLLRHYIHDVEVALYYMDIRAFGKGYEQFYRRAVAEGVNVIKGKVARVTQTDNFDLILRVELLDEGGRVDEHRYDLVVLSQGLIAALAPRRRHRHRRCRRRVHPHAGDQAEPVVHHDARRLRRRRGRRPEGHPGRDCRGGRGGDGRRQLPEAVPVAFEQAGDGDGVGEAGAGRARH